MRRACACRARGGCGLREQPQSVSRKLRVNRKHKYLGPGTSDAGLATSHHAHGVASADALAPQPARRAFAQARTGSRTPLAGGRTRAVSRPTATRHDPQRRAAAQREHRSWQRRSTARSYDRARRGGAYAYGLCARRSRPTPEAILSHAPIQRPRVCGCAQPGARLHEPIALGLSRRTRVCHARTACGRSGLF